MGKRRFRASWCIRVLAILVLLATAGLRADETKAKPEVDVLLWFDTEDYLLPADDDATKHLAEMLTERQIRATFKLVGEKARVLEARGRTDVIGALKPHDIGYHSNYHSVHPAPAEYLADCGFLDGVAEFVRRERAGAADVRRILGRDTLSCYGQPGSSWGCQTIAALAQIGVAPSGVPCYVDEGSHIGLGGQPFWYEGALVVYHMAPNWTRMDLHDPAALEPANKKFSEIADRLRAGGGGLVSIFYHPCEWVHREFWDKGNFAQGANPPRERWRPPPQRPAEETEQAFRRYGAYIDHMREQPSVKFVTAADLPALYPDPGRADGVSEADLVELAKRLSAGDAGIDFQTIGRGTYSAADQFELFSVAVSELVAGRLVRYPRAFQGILGPDSLPPGPREDSQLDWDAFRLAVADVRDYVDTNHRVPPRVYLGADRIPPADFLVALARVYLYHLEKSKLPITEGVQLGKNVAVLPARYVADDSPELFGNWVIHRKGFRAPKILEVARLQAWTLKPAVHK